MNILFLMKVYEVGGQEVVTSVLANCFIQHGHHVSIASFQQPNNTMVARTDTHVHFYTLGKFECSSNQISNLKDILIQEKIDIVINQWGLPYIPIKVLNKAKKGLNIKIISIYHNSPDSNARIKEVDIAISRSSNSLKRLILRGKKEIFYQITRQSMRYVYNHSDLYMVLSSSFVKKFKLFTGISHPNRLLVQTNPITIDSNDFQYIKENKQKEIIYMGRIDYNQKRVYRIIEIWKELEDKNPEWKLTIVGDGPERSNLEKLAKNFNLKRISFEGFQSPKSYYERASILILTSEYEGFPLVLAECMSFGVVPIVYGSYSAVYDIIKHKENGMIVQPHNNNFPKQEMVAQLSYLINNEEQLYKMAQKAIFTSKKDYSLEAIYKSWENIFNQITN